MTVIQDWAAALCVSGIGCSLLHLLCPTGTMRRVFSTLTAVFFFCCLLSPLGSVMSVAADLFTLPSDVTVSQELNDTVALQTEEVLETALLQDAQTRLGDAVTVSGVEIIRDMSRTDSIYIERVRVVLDKQDYPVPSSVYTQLERAWGVAVEVYYVG